MAEQRVAPRQPSQPSQPAAPRQWWRTTRAVVSAVVLTLFIVFMVQNYEDDEIRLIAWRFDVQRTWLLLGAGVVGFVLGWLRPRLRR